MRVLILGGEGMLGHKAFQVLSRRFEVFVTFRRFELLGSRYPVYKDVGPGTIVDGVDAVHFDTLTQAFARVRPNVVINCIGIVKQVRESQDPIISIDVNSLFPHRLAHLCAQEGARLFHISTDCVFSGKRGNYSEDDSPDAEDLYGRTKLLGEVDREGCLTIRTSIIGRDFAKRTALLEWFLSNRGRRVQGYVHAIFSGFSTQSLAHILGDLIESYPDLSGIYHISSAPVSKYVLLVGIRDAMSLDIQIEPYEDLRCDRSLDSSRFRADTGYRIPTWDEMILELANDDTPYESYWSQYGNS